MVGRVVYGAGDGATVSDGKGKMDGGLMGFPLSSKFALALVEEVGGVVPSST